MPAPWKIVVVRAWVDSGVVKARLVSNDGLTATAASLDQALGTLGDWLGDLVPERRPGFSDPDLTGDGPVTRE